MNNNIIVARNYGYLTGSSADSTIEDHVGHGTAVATAAAGEPVPHAVWNILGTLFTGTVSGAAPKAFLGNYKIHTSSFSYTTDTAIAKAVEDAVADGMDVINISSGGPALSLGGSIDVDIVEAAAKAGVLVTIASSDSGPEPATISDPGTATDAITVGSSGSDRILDPVALVGSSDEVYVLPGDGPDPGYPIAGSLKAVAAIDGSGYACSSLPAGSLNGQVALILRDRLRLHVCLNQSWIMPRRQVRSAPSSRTLPRIRSISTAVPTSPPARGDFARDVHRV